MIEDYVYRVPHVQAHVSNEVDSFSFYRKNPTPFAEVKNGTKILHVPTLTHNAYDLAFKSVDMEFGPIATTSLAWKTVSTEWLYEVSNLTRPVLALRQDTCRHYNQMALEWAEQNLPRGAKERLDKGGERVKLLEDKSVFLKNEWQGSEIASFREPLEVDLSGVQVTVRSIAYYSPLHGKHKHKGAFYCQTLSPGYALELLSLEALRHRRALKTNPEHDNSDDGPQGTTFVV
jgi:hypothetical protein